MGRKEYIRTSTRAEFAFQKFGRYYPGRVLDIGAGGSVHVNRPLLGQRYVAADVSRSRGNPDIIVNLEHSPLPFKDNAFETVLCFDCLEHCDNIHSLFDELVRISSRFVIISLPNNWPGFLTSLLYGHNITHVTGYGLPGDDPIPGVRHKWWFNLEEAEQFVLRRAEKNGAKVAEVQYIYEPGDGLLRIFGFYPKIMQVRPDHMKNLLVRDVAWIKRHGKLAWTAYRGAQRLGTPGVMAAYYLLRFAIGVPLSWIDEGFKRLIWGFGSYRYLNLFCRQLWIVLEKPGLHPSTAVRP